MATTTLRKGPLLDPPIRRDGTCYVCQGPRPVIDDPKGIYRVYEDPFCSTKCCKEYYQVSWFTDSTNIM